MKANQAFKQNEEAVSPVIGVILMVAITVVLAAVVFVLVTRLASNQKDETPKLSFTTDSDEDDGVGAVITVTGWTGPAEAKWSSMEAVYNGGLTSTECIVSSSTSNIIGVGDEIDCNEADSGETLIIRYKPTNTVALTYEF